MKPQEKSEQVVVIQQVQSEAFGGGPEVWELVMCEG